MCTTKCQTYVELYSASNAVTGSNFLAVVRLPDGEKIRFIVDLGVFQEREYEELNAKLNFEPSEVDFALVTHAHVDHCGRLPLLAKEGYEGKIYMSEDTAKLMPYVLGDTCRVMKTKAKRNNQSRLFDENDVANVCHIIQGKPFGEAFMPHENVRVTFLRNGHLQGAAMILVRIYNVSESVNILFTGDYSKKNTFFSVGELPKWIRELPLTIVTESTYGDEDATEIVPCFRKNVEKACKEGCSILIPAFSLGRSQEILYVLKTMQDNGTIDKNIPVYLDGKLAIQYTEFYKTGYLEIDRKMLNFLPDNFHYVGKGTRDELIGSKNQKIIVTSSGMGTYGPAQLYIPAFLPRPKQLIHFTGYCAVGTFGRRLKDTQVDDMVMSGDGAGMVAVKKCVVDFTEEFSGHAKRDELLEFLSKFNCKNSIIVNHGEPKTKAAFAKKLVEKFEDSKVAVIGASTGFRIGKYGIIRSLNVDIR